MPQFAHGFTNFILMIESKGRVVIYGRCYLRKAHCRRGRLLPASRIMDFVIENDVKEILRLMETNRRERAHFHERSTITVDYHHRLARQSARHSKADGRSGAHSADDVKVVRSIRDRE